MVPRNVENNHWKKIISESTGKFVLIIARICCCFKSDIPKIYFIFIYKLIFQRLLNEKSFTTKTGTMCHIIEI